MMSHWEQNLTDRIHAWGKPHYRLWYWFAVELINIYVVAWVVFGLLGWMKWWVIPAVAFAAWILTLCTQAVVGRNRPNFEESTGYKMWWRTYALPSGHATISAAVATVIMFQLHFSNPFVFVLMILLAVIIELLIGLGRIVVGVHYVGDVLVGFVLGIAFGVVYALL
jgi:membrane-associated phospholipid phosphatase